jgi:hypothetical protein
MPIDAWGFRTLRASRVQNPATMLAENRRPGSRKRPTPDGEASVPPNAGPRADCGHGDAVAARRSTALAQPTASAARWSWGRRLLARRSNRCENWGTAARSVGWPKRVAHAVATGTASSRKWRIDPLPRCPPSRQVRPPALDFHRCRSEMGGDRGRRPGPPSEAGAGGSERPPAARHGGHHDPRGDDPDRLGP